MLLTYNIGNDEILLGFVKDGTLAATAAICTDTRKTADEYAILLRQIFDFNGFDTDSFEGAICSSVVPTLTETLRAALEKVLGIRVHVIGAGTKTGLRIRTDDPTQLGSDLVAMAVGALCKYKGPMILISFGAATVFSAIDEEGAFLGCAIAPGVSLAANALSSGASLLPQFAAASPKKCIGTNTMESMQSGCIFGNAAMVDGMLERMSAEIGDGVSYVASGKDCERILPFCSHSIAHDDTLLLIGLAKIYEKNNRKK